MRRLTTTPITMLAIDVAEGSFQIRATEGDGVVRYTELLPDAGTDFWLT